MKNKPKTRYYLVFGFFRSINDNLMTEYQFYILQIASTLSVAVPLLAGLLVFKRSSPEIKLFVAFLVFDLISDLSGWYFFLTKNVQANIFAHQIYYLVWAFFWFWFIGNVSPTQWIRYIFSRAWIVLVPFTILMLIQYSISNLFELTTHILVSFTTAFCLLKMVERQSNTSRSLTYWILLGIFFYSFSVLTIKGISFSPIAAKIWYAHNLVNISTNLIYLIGFLRCRVPN